MEEVLVESEDVFWKVILDVSEGTEFALGGRFIRDMCGYLEVDFLVIPLSNKVNFLTIVFTNVNFVAM
jgi:hypothetical protein